jgi:hypothetical protein
VVEVVPAEVVYQVKVPAAQELTTFIVEPEHMAVELKVGMAGMAFTVCVTLVKALAQPEVASTHLAKYVAFAVKFPVGDVVVVVPAEVVYQVKVPVAQELVTFTAEPEHMAVELKVGIAGIGFTICVTLVKALAQPEVASTHLAKYVELAVKFPVGAVVVTVPAEDVYQVKVPVAQELVTFTAEPEHMAVELNVGIAGIAFKVCVTLATALAQPEVASTHLAKYVAFAVKFPVGAVVVVVPAEVVYHVNVPAAQELVTFTTEPEHIAVELKVGIAGIVFTVCVTLATALAQPEVASTHLAKYVELAVKFPVGAVVVVVPAEEVYQVNVPVAQELVTFTADPEQIAVELIVGMAGIGFTVCVTLVKALAQPEVASTHFAK